MCDHHHLLAPTPAGDVDHVNHLSENIGALFQKEDYSDVIIKVQNLRFPTHKVVLAARSEYFRALFFGGLKESTESEVELKDTNSSAFHHLLKYIYTGKMNLTEMKEDILLNVLGLAHQYVFKELETSISDYLKAILNLRNVCLIYDIASMYDLKSLCQTCCDFIDRNAEEIITSEAFNQLSPNALQELIKRDSFCAPEIKIFQAIQQWKEQNPDEAVKDIMSCIRLPLVHRKDLFNTVRPSSLVCADAILDAIKVQDESQEMQLNHRGYLIPEENIASLRHGANVIRGEMKASLLDGDNQNYDLDRGFSRHPIDDNSGQGIVIKLAKNYMINTIKMLLWDRDMRSYSYYIEVSMDDQDWVKVIDHSRYLCRSWQYLRFPHRVVKYVRVVGTHNTVNRVFHLVSFECMFSRKSFNMDPDLGIIIPEENVATTFFDTTEKSACVIEGVSRSRNALINGDTKNYDWDSGYTCHQLGSGAIVVQLSQPYVIGSMRLLLWDCDSRSYSYYIEVSTDQAKWHLVADKTREACRSWQTIMFEERPVTFIKIVGTHNTANEVFHCVHFECPADPSAVEEYRRTHKDHPIPPPVNTVPHIPVHDPQEDYLASNSDPEDDAQHNMLRNAGHYNPPYAARGGGALAAVVAPAAAVHGGGASSNNLHHQQLPSQPQLLEPGNGVVNNAGNSSSSQQPVDRGDGFGFEPTASGGAATGGRADGTEAHVGENNPQHHHPNREEEEAANNSIHSD